MPPKMTPVINVGWIGLNNVVAISTPREMQTFFELCRQIGPISRNEDELFFDRFYRRTVRMGDLDLFEESVNSVFSELQHVKATARIANAFSSEISSRKIDFAARNLGDFFRSYYDSLTDIIEYHRLRIQKGNNPKLRIGVTDIPDCFETIDRDDLIYEKLQGNPLWLTEELGSDVQTNQYEKVCDVGPNIQLWGKKSGS